MGKKFNYKFKVGDRVLYEGDKATVVQLRTAGTGELEHPYYDVMKDKEKGKIQYPANEKELTSIKESKLRQLIEAANRKCEMAWKVYSYNPEKDNELVDTSKAFDCIAAAQAHKRDILEKNPNYIVEIIAESSQKNEAVTKSNYKSIINDLEAVFKKFAGGDLKLEHKKKPNSFDLPLDTCLSVPLKDKAKLEPVKAALKKVIDKYGARKVAHKDDFAYNFGETNKDGIYVGWNWNADRAFLGYAVNPDFDVKYLSEAANIDVKNPGVLEVPDGKKVDELPQSHFEKLVDKKGYAEVIRALTNLEVWNKDKNKSLSSWASNMADKLKKKFRPESAQKNEEMDRNTLAIIAKEVRSTFNNLASIKSGIGVDYSDRLGELTFKIAIEVPTEKLHDKLEDERMKLQKNLRLKYKDFFEKNNLKPWGFGILIEENPRYWHNIKSNADYYFESAQMNEDGTSWFVTLELRAPSSMNNKAVEDKLEKVIEQNGITVLDVTAERK